MPRTFLFLLIMVKKPIETWENILDFTFNLPDVSLFIGGHSLKGVSQECYGFEFQNGLYHLDDNFSNLVNGFCSCKTVVTHVIKGFSLCQQRGFSELGKELDSFSTVLQKK